MLKVLDLESLAWSPTFAVGWVIVIVVVPFFLPSLRRTSPSTVPTIHPLLAIPLPSPVKQPGGKVAPLHHHFLPVQ